MFSALAYLIELLGFCCIVAAAWLVALPLGLLALGVALVFVAAASDSSRKRPRR